MPGRGPAANETPSPRLKSITRFPVDARAYDEATGIRPADPFLAGDRRRRQPEAPNDIEGGDPDATMLAPPGGIEPDGIVFVRETRPRRSGDAPVDVTMNAPGDSTFADAVARLASVVSRWRHNVAGQVRG